MASHARPLVEKPRDMASIQCQKQMRLRVNRVAIVQELRVEHILPYLKTKKVLTPEEILSVEQKSDPKDRTRYLIDILPSKGKTCDWYTHFRDSLKYPNTTNADVKRRYQVLIEFLDNTIINYIPKIGGTSSRKYVKDIKFPRYDPLPNIDMTSGIENNVSATEQADSEDKYDNGKPKKNKTVSTVTKPPLTVTKSYFQMQISSPENFKSLIQEPEDMLNTINSANDEKILTKEKVVVKKLRNLEVLFFLARREQLPEGFELSTSKAVLDIVTDRDSYHLYLKYLNHFKDNHYMDVLKEIAVLFGNFVSGLENAEDNETRECVISIGFGLFDLLKDSGYYWRAEWLMSSILFPFLQTWPQIETWMSAWRGHIKLMAIHNMNYQFKAAYNDYNAATRLAAKIKLLSFGQDLLDESEMLLELSVLMREQGSDGPSYVWAQAALKEVEEDNHHGIVEVLCNAVEACGAKGLLKKGLQLSVMAIQQARLYFGTDHPLYVKALLHFCHFSNEYIQEDMGIEVAKEAVKIADRIYNTDSIVTAQAHRTLAVALLVKKPMEHEVAYFYHAVRALRIAQDVLAGTHPVLSIFRYTLALCLLWKSMCEEKDQAEGTLIWAEKEMLSTLNMFTSYFGQYSLKATQAHVLLGQIYMQMERYQEAENYFKESWAVHEISMSPHSFHSLLIKSILGTYFEKTDKLDKAVEQMKDAVELADASSVNRKWLRKTYQQLIRLLKAIDSQAEANHYENHLASLNMEEMSVTWDQLNAEPAQYQDFISNLNIWSRKFKMDKGELKNLQILESI